MHVYKSVHGGGFLPKLFYAWLQIHKRDLHGNENLIKRRNIYLIFWDGSINVILIPARGSFRFSRVPSSTKWAWVFR